METAGRGRVVETTGRGQVVGKRVEKKRERESRGSRAPGVWFAAAQDSMMRGAAAFCSTGCSSC